MKKKVIRKPGEGVMREARATFNSFAAEAERRTRSIQETAARIANLNARIGNLDNLAPRIGAIGIAIDKLTKAIEQIPQYHGPRRSWWRVWR